METLRSEIQSALEKAIEKATLTGKFNLSEKVAVLIQYPPAHQDDFAGYASPVALAIGKMAKQNPLEVAEAIVAELENIPFVAEVKAVAPGFINFRLSSEWMGKKMDDIVEKGNLFGVNNRGKGKTINLEFVSANPTGMPTFGNGRALFWADSLGRVLEKSGYSVTREYYINDVGNQVRLYGESVLRRILQHQLVDVEFPENLYQGGEVNEIALKVAEIIAEEDGHVFLEKDLTDEEFLKRISRVSVDTTVSGIREMIESVCKVKYDVWFKESFVHENGEVKKVLDDLKEKGESYEKDGALWLSSTKYGDDKDRVLMKENGELTYLVADIAYHRDKLRRGFNEIVDFWGADHYGYVARIRAALQALGEDVSRLKIIITQLTQVIDGGEKKKMSKRAGTSVPLNEIVQKAGLSATRFFLTQTALASQMEFDVDLAQEKSDRNPVFYVQYAYVRLASILRKAQENNIVDGDLIAGLGVKIAMEGKAELDLMTKIFRLPEIVEDVAESWEVQRLPHFAVELAKSIHYFYDTVPVLVDDDKDTLFSRLTLALAAKTTLGNLMDLLGVEKLDVM